MATPKRTPSTSKLLSRPPLERMLLIHEKLKNDKFPNCATLSEEIEISERTILRDIQFMQTRLGLPIEYHREHYGYYYSEPVTSFPNLQVSESEIVAVFMAQKALEQYRGTPFEAPMASAFKKLSESLQGQLSFSWHDLDSSISFRGIGTTESDLALFEALSTALRKSVEIEFEYRKLTAPTFEKRLVRPYHLGCIDQQWYLFGFDLDRKAIRAFVLPRIRKFSATAKTFERPPSFSIEKHLKESFGVFRSDGQYKINIRFDTFAAQLIRERKWHRSQKIRELPKGELELTLVLNSLPEAERWVLSWGLHAKVIEPKELKKRIKAIAKGLTQFYK